MNRLVIRIKKPSQAEICMGILIIMPFAFAMLIELLKLPSVIKYVCDIAYVFLFLLIAINSIEKKRICKKEIFWISLFFIFTFLVYIFRFQSPLYFLWGARNNFRFYIAFFSFAAFLKNKNIGDYWKVFEVLFWINVILALIQFYGFGFYQDFLGGIFGTEYGCNGFSSMFMCIVASKSIVFFAEKKEGALSCFSKCAAALYISALAELKFFFVAFLIIVFLAMVYTKFSWRKIFGVFLAISGTFAGALFLGRLFPSFENWFSVEMITNILASESGYTSSGDLNRLYVFAPINNMWLKTWGQRMVGLGLGNCDTSSFALVNTPFFERFGDMHYSWISYAFMYLECGIIGLLFYFGFFVLVYFDIKRIEKTCTGDDKSYCRIARIMAIMCIIISIYNSSLRTEAGYMAYFVLAIPFAIKRENPKLLIIQR